MILWLHLLGAMIWVGGHVILVFGFLIPAFSTHEIGPLQEFESRFEKIGIPALLLQIITGFMLAHERVPDISQWLNFSTPTFRVIPLKLLALLMTLALAVHARFFIWPHLSPQRLPLFAAHVLLVTLLAISLMTLGLGYRLGWV